MKKEKRVLLVSCSIIMICLCIIAGMAYALFTDSVSVGNHLQAGNLDATLTRTNLKYCVLNSEGVLQVHTNSEEQNFTESTRDENNIFGISSEGIKIVPGSYFEADMEVGNNGNTAFDYKVRLALFGETTELAKQLKVTFTRYNADGSVSSSTETKMLSELAGGGAVFVSNGNIKVGEAKEKFTVRVDFIDDVNYNAALPDDATISDRMNNNLAQSGNAIFDLVVEATQATANAAA